MTTATLSLHDFPPEIIQEFLSQNPDSGTLHSPPDHEIDLLTRQTISACRLTCKYFNTIARPFHFHTVRLGFSKSTEPERCIERITQFLAMLDEDPTIAPGVREFWLYGSRLVEGPLIYCTVVGEVWTNDKLPIIFTRLTSLKKFVLEGYPPSPNSAVSWDDNLGKEMQEALRHLVSMPTVTTLRISHITSLPMDLVMGCTGLRHLEVNYIDSMSTWNLPVPSPDLKLTPRHRDSRKVVSIKAGMMCNSLLAILGHSSDTLRDLTITLHTTDAHSPIFDPFLDQYKSLTTLRVQMFQRWSNFEQTLLGNLPAFLTTQFKRPSPCVTCFQLQVMPVDIADFFRSDTMPMHIRPTQWEDLEAALQASFPHLSMFVLESGGRLFPDDVEQFKVFAKWVLPVISKMQSIRLLLRFKLKYGSNGMEEVDMTGFNVNMAAQISSIFSIL